MKRASGSLATLQLLMTLVIVGMEVGNALVDLYKANVYSGFWSFPFTISATIATYVCVCTKKKTKTKALIALICQCVAIVVLLAVLGFLIAIISSNFTLCLGSQCSQNSTTFLSTSSTAYLTYSSTTYALLKRVFISCELVSAVLFILLAVAYIFLFVKCLKQSPRISPMKRGRSNRSALSHRLTSSASRSSHVQTMTRSTYNAQKICPNCSHVSPYDLNDDVLECPKCSYRSNLVEHAQQW